MTYTVLSGPLNPTQLNSTHPAAVTSPHLTPAKAGTRFSDPGGMEGWVDLGAGYNS